MRLENGVAPSCEVQNGYLFGLFKTLARRIDNVSNIGYGTPSVRNMGNARQTRVSTVVLKGNGAIPVFETSSNVNAGQKQEVIQQVKQFLEDHAQPSLRIETWFSNIFGWIGLPLFLVVVPGFVYSIIWYAWRAIRRWS